MPPPPLPLFLQLEEWEADPSAGQLSLVEALREVLAALLKDLTRNNRWDTSPNTLIVTPVSTAAP
jgi:hypothetical protein